MSGVRIPIYEQQQGASGLGPQPRATGLDIPDPVGQAIGNVGKSLEQVAEVGARLLNKQKEEDARAYAGKALSDAHVLWQDNLQQRQQSAQPGATDFTPGVLKDFDEWSKTAIEQAPTAAAKQYLGQHLISYRTQLASQALNFESQARIGWRTDEFTKAVDNWAVTVAKDPSKYSLAVSALNETVPEVGPIQQEKLRDYMRKALVQGAAAGQVQANPEAAYNLLTLSTLPPDAGVSRDKTGTLTAPTSGSGNRGIRNNNPGNLIKSDIAWKGKVAGGDPKFEVFETPEAGIRAAAKNLIAYQDQHGRNTVARIIAAWAPASENNTGAYIANVSKALGVKPDEPINVKDPATMKKLVGAIITQENGAQPYSDAQIDTGIGAALGTGKLPVAPGIAPVQAGSGSDDSRIGVPWVDAMSLQERLHYLQAADSEVRRRQQIARSELELKEHDQNSQAMAGKPVSSPLTLSDYVRAYGQVDGPRRYGEYVDNQQFGANVNQVAAMSPAEQQALLNRNTPTPNASGFANDQRRYELLAKAVETTTKQRLEDPLGFAVAHKLATLSPINFADPKSVAKELTSRTLIAAQNSNRWGAPYQVLMSAEADQLGVYLQSLPPIDRARVLGQINRAGGVEALKSIAVQLKEKDRTLSIAGTLEARSTQYPRLFDSAAPGRNVAQLYLEGKDALAQNRAKIDKTSETGTEAKIFKAIEGVYLTPQARDDAADAAFAIYAKFKSEGTDDLQQALAVATGGIMDFNGAKIAKPYGWGDGQFRDFIAKAAPNKVTAASPEFIVGNHKLSAADLSKSLPGAKLQTYGDGTYMILAGHDIVRLPNGSPFILKVGP